MPVIATLYNQHNNVFTCNEIQLLTTVIDIFMLTSTKTPFFYIQSRGFVGKQAFVSGLVRATFPPPLCSKPIRWLGLFDFPST